MKLNSPFILVLCLLITLTLLFETAQAQLTGAWKDDNGVTYCVQQSGNDVFWYMNDQPRVHNVFYGIMAGDYLTGQWADLPGGQLRGNGTLSLRIESNDRMVKIGQSAEYLGSEWTRIDEDACAQTKTLQRPDVSGEWKYEGKSEHTITQDGTYLILEHKPTNWRVEAWIREDHTTIEDKAGNVIGTITNNGRTIEWSNNSTWER
jgi:hypothetical protein